METRYLRYLKICVCFHFYRYVDRQLSTYIGIVGMYACEFILIRYVNDDVPCHLIKLNLWTVNYYTETYIH